jgi:hypothetical protein
MSRLAARHKVLFVNSLGMRVPSLTKDRNATKKILRKLASLSRYLRKSHGMYVFTPLSVPLQSPAGKKLNQLILRAQIRLAMRLLGIAKPVFYVGCPPAWEAIKSFARSMLIYERSDYFSEMPGADKCYISDLDHQLMRSADLVLYVNRRLMAAGANVTKKNLLIGHGVDFDYFSTAENSTYIPKDTKTIPRPVVGFFGDISEETVDFDLLAYAAKDLPNIPFVLVGAISSDIKKLRPLKNIYFLGKNHIAKYRITERFLLLQLCLGTPTRG